MESWIPMGKPEMVSMSKEEFNSRIAEATERGYHEAIKAKTVEKNKIANEIAVSLAKAVLLLSE